VKARGEPGADVRQPEVKSVLFRYLVAVALALLAAFVNVAIVRAGWTGPFYTPLVGAAALVTWYAGLGPALVLVGIAWPLTLWLSFEPRGSVPLTTSEGVQAAIGLLVAVLVVLTSHVLRMGRRGAVTRAVEAEQSARELVGLNDLSGALSGAVSAAEVGRVLTTLGARLLSADGAVVGLLEGEELVLVQPSGLASHLAREEPRLPLGSSRTITRAVREGRVIQANDRDELRTRYGATAASLPTAGSAVAAPLRAGGEIVGALGFLFHRERALEPNTVALAETLAGLGEQALERAWLYENERSTRQALDRILLVAPRFRTETADVPGAICHEARMTFGADYAVLWQVLGDELEIVGIEPPDAVQPGTTTPLEDFPGLEVAVKEVTTSFVADVLEEARGSGLGLVRELGVRSSLRTPIAIRGLTGRVLSLWWKDVVDEPDRSTLVAIRRFADQAGLALEEAERRRAQAEAARRTAELRRMLTLSAALSNAVTRSDVAAVVVEQVGDAVDADGAALAALVDGPPTLRLLSSRGYEDDVLEYWREVPPDASNVLTRVLRRRVSAFYSLGDLQRLAGGPEEIAFPTAHTSFLLVPLVAGRRANGVLVLSWAASTEPDLQARSYVESLAAQAAQALDRAGHFESERTIAETLQRSVLPASLPQVDGVQLAARYLPGTAELDVGGDWFDAMQLPDGRLGLVVGDVVGKGVFAAASMAQLRNALRAFSVDRLKPATALARLDRLADEVLDTTFATIAYVSLDPTTGVCRVACAGHPPPLVVGPDGTVELLEGGRGLPLGTGIRSKYSQQVVRLPAGSLLLLYSDGLIERPGRSIDDGLALLREAAAEAPRAPEALLDAVLETMLGSEERRDDVAVLAARILPVAPRELDLRVPGGSLDLVREALRTWLDGTALGRVEREELVLAAWEACANAVEHPVDPAERAIRVRAALDRKEVRVVVEDSGRWKPPSTRPGRGLGLLLMRTASTALDVEPGVRGTRVTIAKAIAPPALEEPDEQQDDDDQQKNTTADVHAASFRRLPS